MSQQRTVPPLCIAVLGDFDGVHTRRWLEVFVQRGHEMHAISFYRPNASLPGVTVHVLSGDSTPTSTERFETSTGGSLSLREKVGVRENLASTAKRRIPPSLQRGMHAARYMRAGLKRMLGEIQPDVFHAHYAVEHGFYGSFAGFHPYVVSAWGSDLLVESRKPLGRLIARRALRSADLVTANDVSLAHRATELGVPAERIEVVHLGIEPAFLDAGMRSANLREDSNTPPTVISTRALEPLYNVDVIVRAFARMRARLPAARLIVTHDGNERTRLEGLAGELGVSEAVDFRGRLAPEELAEALAGAHVYVSAPSSDSLALSTVEALAAGAFPVVSALPSNEGWIEHGENALVVPPRDVAGLADALLAALTDRSLRSRSVDANRAKVAAVGLRERNMLLMERHYFRLAGHPRAGGGEMI